MRIVNPTHDALAIAILRLTLDEVFSDRRFFDRKSMSACQVADFILTLVLRGERDLDLLKASAFKKLSGALPAQLRISDSMPTATLDAAKCLRIMQ
jgi:hypothetical protein